MKKRVGIIGQSGRMGQVLSGELTNQPDLEAGLGYSKEAEDVVTLDALFAESDVVIDFSNASLVEAVLTAGIAQPKPLIICTTGWDQEALAPLVERFTKRAPLIIASNTSVGAAVQRYLVRKLATVLGGEFDVDLHEKHHRFKVDSPSGTAVTLLEEIEAGKAERGEQYERYTVGNSAREENRIGVSVQRAGSIVGEHSVTFTSLAEQIEIRHTSFDRALFAQGAILAARWLLNHGGESGNYTMFDVLDLNE